MAEIKWTKEQNDAIIKKDSNILVAAAAGSGKTAVLVERIIRKIIEDKIDIDKMLVVTFTSAAASEMREKILDAIYKKIDENPYDLNLQRQINLLNKSSICTIDSFCLDVIRNNFFEINISANARVADVAEINLLKQEVLDEIFEEKYMNNDPNFLDLIEKYTKYNRDEELQKIILEIYDFMQTTPFPDDWINEKVQMFQKETKNQNLSENIWGKVIVNNIQEILKDCIYKEKNILDKMAKFPELGKFIITIEEDLKKYDNIKTNLNNWDKAVEIIKEFKYEKWPIDRKCENDLKVEAKEVRDKVKSEFEKIKEIMIFDTNECYQDMLYMHNVLNNLKTIILEFSEKFTQKKIEKNIIDFNDIEHLALKILVQKDENGIIRKTEVANKYAEKFEEIAIDEYQDSNDIQEMILNSVSKGNNIFMVGDVKQSIYKFRQACPEIFLNKYNSYKLEPKENEDRKIQLFKNFRSRKNILDITNIVFENIMSEELGEIEYNQNEYLNLGANYEKSEQNLKTELNIINLKDEDNIWKTDDTEDGEEESEKIENIVLEARLVAKKIKELIDNKYQVFDKKTGKRDIRYSDIAILLRSANVVAPIYEKEISDLGINVYTDNSKNYFESIEIDTIISVLKIINNPMQDIPLVTVMRSAIANFTDNELIEISFEKDNLSFYNKTLKCLENTKNENLKNKITYLLNLLEKWREEEKYKSLDELIWTIYIDTGYLEFVRLLPNGKLKVENLKLLFEKAKQYESASFKGLYNFINFLDKLKLSNGDSNSAKIIGENENVVRIMSIHKSKGLEFPVVILAETGKKFNFMGLNKKILLHKDLGIGPQYIDEERHIEFKTLAKTAINIAIKNEMIAEEMRILYVALTRAKEKLIITAVQKDYYKSNDEKINNIMSYNVKNKLPPYIIKKYNSYLDWLELVYLSEGKTINKIMELNIVSKNDLLKNMMKNEVKDIYEEFKEEAKKYKDSEREKKIKDRLDWKYDFKGLEEVPSKVSVTKLKEMYNKKAENIETNYKPEKIKPKFLDENIDRITGAQKGTLMHLCLKMMDETQEYNKSKIEDLINQLIVKELITENEAKALDQEKIFKYTQSDLWKDLKEAKAVYKEQPFYINIPIKEVYKESSSEDNILVQGIIDLYYINKDNEIVLVDYKTDFINKGEESKLIKEYSQQLRIYKEALEQAINRKVARVQIYSLYLNKSIDCD